MSIVLPEFGGATIRVDKETQFASLKDLLLLFDYSEANVNKVINGLPVELRDKCALIQLNGVGQKMLCAPANTLIEIVWALKSSKTYAFRSQCAKTICRVLGGDLSLAEEIEKRHATISDNERSFFIAPVAPPPLPQTELKRVKIEKTVTKTTTLLIKDKTKPLRGTLSQVERAALWNVYYGNTEASRCCLDGVRIVYKHHAGFEAAHVKSVFSSGDNEAWNMVPTCPGCNADMGTMHLLEWVVQGRYLPIASHSGPATRSSTISEPKLRAKWVFEKMHQLYCMSYPFISKEDFLATKLGYLSKELIEVII